MERNLDRNGSSRPRVVLPDRTWLDQSQALTHPLSTAGSGSAATSGDIRAQTTILPSRFAQALFRNRDDCRQRKAAATAFAGGRAPERKIADHTIETLADVAHATSMKIHPPLDPAYAGPSQARLCKKLGLGMERRNLEEIVHARERLSADQRRERAVNQYDCNSLRQMAAALLEGFPHGQFHADLYPFQRSF